MCAVGGVLRITLGRGRSAPNHGDTTQSNTTRYGPVFDSEGKRMKLIDCCPLARAHHDLCNEVEEITTGPESLRDLVEKL